MPPIPRYLLAGDQALVVEFGDAIDPAITAASARVLLLAFAATGRSSHQSEQTANMLGFPGQSCCKTENRLVRHA